MLTGGDRFTLVSFGQDPTPPILYAEAERVYLDSIGPAAKTNANEIAYWRDRYNSRFGKAGDRLYVFGLLKKDHAVGFALVFFFAKHNLLVIDHMAISEPAREFGSFFYFKQLIAQYILDQGHQVDYVTAEIVTSRGGHPHPVKPELLIELLKQGGFKVAKFRYWTPNVDEAEYDTRIDAVLMILRPGGGDAISGTLLMALLRCILRDLYLRWYAPHTKQPKKFERQIADLTRSYERELAGREYIELDGYRLGDEDGERNRRVLTPALLFVMVVAASGLLAGFSAFLGVSVINIVVVFLVSLAGLLTIFGVWHKAAAQRADKVFGFLLGLLRRDKEIG